MINKIIKKFLTKEFLRFGIVGLINTFNGILFAVIFESFLNELPAFILGYIFAMTISFFLNTIYTYKVKPTLIRFVKFPISYIPNFIIQVTVYAYLIENVDIHTLISKFIAVALGIPATYLTMTYLIKK